MYISATAVAQKVGPTSQSCVPVSKLVGPVLSICQLDVVLHVTNDVIGRGWSHDPIHKLGDQARGSDVPQKLKCTSHCSHAPEQLQREINRIRPSVSQLWDRCLDADRSRFACLKQTEQLLLGQALALGLLIS